MKTGENLHDFGCFLVIGTPERTLTSDLPLRRRPLYTAELLGHIFYVHHRDILLRIFVVVKKNRHIFHWEWNILSNSLFERSFKNAFPPYGAGRSG